MRTVIALFIGLILAFIASSIAFLIILSINSDGAYLILMMFLPASLIFLPFYSILLLIIMPIFVFLFEFRSVSSLFFCIVAMISGFLLIQYAPMPFGFADVGKQGQTIKDLKVVLIAVAGVCGAIIGLVVKLPKDRSRLFAKSAQSNIRPYIIEYHPKDPKE